MSANVTELTADEVMKRFQQRVHRAAVAYIERGWGVFPVHTIDARTGRCTCGTECGTDAGKHPEMARWQKAWSKDRAKIDEWFGPEAPPRNIGVVTGAISSITVLDVDTGEGKNGAATWAELIAEAGEPNTLMAKTGSGGMHVVFKYNAALKTRAHALGDNVDCRNDGGYIVAAPSRHRSGGAYAWANGWESDIQHLPPHLLEKKPERRGRPRKDDLSRKNWSLEAVQHMLSFVDASDRDDWRNVGIILGREFAYRADEAWDVYVEWADSAGGNKGRNHDEIMRQCFYEIAQDTNARTELTIGSIVYKAQQGGWAPTLEEESPKEDFYYYAPTNSWYYRLKHEYWPAPGVDSKVSPINEGGKIMKASEWIRQHAVITSVTKRPEMTELTKGVDVNREGVLVKSGGATYNEYVKSDIEGGDARLATPFIDHVRKVFARPSPGEGVLSDADQFIQFMAHRVQRPEEKPQFCLLIAGPMGTGKDTAIEACIPAIGDHNFGDIEPDDILGQFNEWMANTLIRINEASNVEELSKWQFYEKTKRLITGTKATVNMKYGAKFNFRPYSGLVMTTNHLLTGIYIPPGDRRYDIIETPSMAQLGWPLGIEDPGRKEYFAELYNWLKNENGFAHVAAYLASVDIGQFDAANGQRPTEAFKAAIKTGMEADDWLDDALEVLGRPMLVRNDHLMKAVEAAGENLQGIKRKIGTAMQRAGFSPLMNPGTKDGRWKFGKLNSKVWHDANKGQWKPSDMDALHHEKF